MSRARIACISGVVGATWLGLAAVWADPAGPLYMQRLHSDLALNSSQEQDWKLFEQAYQVNPQDVARERDAAAKMSDLTGPQRVDLAISLSEQDLSDLRHRADVLKTFYASLSRQQQNTFDRDTLPPSGRGY